MSPPPTRGWSLYAAQGFPLDYVSPAHAGMVPSPLTSPLPPVRLPRPRGDGPWAAEWKGTRLQSPPPTRGWSLQLLVRGRQHRVSPAYAGMVR